jgi:LytS/YehU family sensor histidine kinase
MEYTHQFMQYISYYVIFRFIKVSLEHQEHKLKTAQLKEQLTNARLQSLQMKLHPHFLFNTLNLISSVMYEDVQLADTMMANLSDLLRTILNSTDSSEHTLEKEMEMLRYYIDIMKARFQEKLTVTFDIDSDTREAMIPALIIQPIVENSIKHNIETLTENTSAEIHVSSQKTNNTITLRINDNGPGVADNREHFVKNGIGLSNVTDRLETLYGKNHRFQMQNLAAGGFETIIEIPFRRMNREITANA